MEVRIELVDQASGETIAESTVPLDSLPARFAGMETTLTVGDSQYNVVKAEPPTRDEIAKAGTARLTLRKVEAVDPKSILFSMPTLEDSQPAMAAAPKGVDVHVKVTPDDYRQVELVHASQMSFVDTELQDIRRVLAEHRKGAGYDQIHVRKRLPEPLDGARLTVAELEEALDSKRRPLGLRGSQGMVRDGYAVPLSDAVVYGLEAEGRAASAAVHGILDDVIGLLHPVALRHGLVLVDWRKAEVLRAHEEGWIR